MKTKLIFLFIFLLAAALRIYNIEQKNLWFDEIFSWHISEGSIEQIVAETSGDIHPPFYYLVLKLWISFFSDSIFSMRMLSVLFGLLSMIFIYRISDKIFKNNSVTIVVLLLYAVSPVNIYYSQEARMLNLNLFLCAGSVYYFYELISKTSFKNGMLYFTFTLLAIYTHYFSLLIFFTEFLIALIFYFTKGKDKRSLINFFISAALINLFYAPWYPVFFSQSAKGQPWRTDQTLIQSCLNAAGYFKDVFLSTYYAFENSFFIYFANLTGIVLTIFILTSVILNFKNKKKLFSGSDYLILFFIVPYVIAILISMKQSILLSRYLSILIPFLLFMLIYFSIKLYSKKFYFVFIAFLILESSLGIYILNNNNFKNNDYRRIITYIENNFNKGDMIIAEPHFMGWSINYHIKHNLSDLTPPVVFGWDLGMQLDSVRVKKDVNGICFITDYSSLGRTNYDSLPQIMTGLGYSRRSFKTFYILPEKVRVDFYSKNF
ncbi:MAG: glycosyltransferase family 39 protein [Ignavibacteria bacterium]